MVGGYILKRWERGFMSVKDVKQLLESTRDEIEDAKEKWRKEMEAAGMIYWLDRIVLDGKFLWNWALVLRFIMNGPDTKLHGLAQAAAEYHKVVAENRELYNQVQDLKGKIKSGLLV